MLVVPIKAREDNTFKHPHLANATVLLASALPFGLVSLSEISLPVCAWTDSKMVATLEQAHQENKQLQEAGEYPGEDAHERITEYPLILTGKILFLII